MNRAGGAQAGERAGGATSVRIRLLLSLGSALVGAGLSYALWLRRPPPPTVTFVDNAAEVEALLDARAAAAEPGPPAAALDPVHTGATGPQAARSESSPFRLDGPLVRLPVDEATAQVLFGSLGGGKGHFLYDPQAYFWERGHRRAELWFPEHPAGRIKIETNAHGFRKSVEVRSTPPDLRILVTGDSHTAGVVPNEEQFGNLLEERLDARRPERSHEVLNAGKGGYSAYNYLGVLEKFLPLEPDVFVVTLFGGNDFVCDVKLFRYFNRLPASPKRRDFSRKHWDRLREERPGMLAQGFNQTLGLARRPGDGRLAVVAVCQALVEMQRICEREGIRMLVVYVPPCQDVQPETMSPALPGAVRLFDLSEEELQATNRVIDPVLAFLEGRGVTAIDMRPAYRASEEPCYWRTDLHINTLGHRLITEALLEVLTSESAR